MIRRRGHLPRSLLDLERLLAGAQLAALPQSALRLLELTRGEQNGPIEIAAPIEADPGLTGQVLRLVNSSYFGFARKISSVRHAISLVGVRTIKNFALWNAVFSMIPNPQCGPFDLKGLWGDSLRRALFSRLLGRHWGLANSEDLFTAALLQDMAVPILANEAPQDYAKLLEARYQGSTRLSAVEQQHFGWTHADASSILARHWALPEELAQLLEDHCRIDDCSASLPGRWDGWIVALSALCPRPSIHFGWIAGSSRRITPRRSLVKPCRLPTFLNRSIANFTTSPR